MNLLDLATPICAEVRQTDSASVAFCKLALTRWMRTIWNKSLWKDALVAFEQVLSPDDYAVTNTWLPTKGVLLCPTIIDRVVAARLDSRRLQAQRQELYYCMDFDAFAASGQATEFVLLPACVWEWDEAQELYLLRANSSDSSIVAITDTLNESDVGVTRTSTTLTNDWVSLVETERIDAFQKAVSVGVVSVGFRGKILCVNNYAGDATFTTTEESAVIASGGSQLLTAGVLGSDITVLHAFPTPDTVNTAAGNYGTVTLSDGDPVASYEATGGQQPTSILSVDAADKSAPKRQRIRLLQIPVAETTIRVLGKRTMPTFESDLDVVPLTGAEGCLGAFAHASMLRRERQYAKANIMLQEALSMLDLLVDNETVQQAHHSVIMPASGFGTGVCRPG